MYRDQNTGQSRNVEIGNTFFESVEQFKYLGTSWTNQNSVQEEIKSSWKSGNACYRLVQSILPSLCYPKI